MFCNKCGFELLNEQKSCPKCRKRKVLIFFSAIIGSIFFSLRFTFLGIFFEIFEIDNNFIFITIIDCLIVTFISFSVLNSINPSKKVLMLLGIIGFPVLSIIIFLF